MCAPDRFLDVPHSDEEQLNAGDLAKNHQLSCSSSGDGVDEEMEGPVLGCFSSGSAPAFVSLQLPLPRSSEFGLWDDTRERQCYEQIKDIITP